MKTVISVGMAFALMLSVVPAMAGETFRAFSTMAAGERARLTALTDEQLAAIEGQGSEFSQYALNSAAVYQANVNYSAFSEVDQRNSAHVGQSISQSSTDAKPAPVAPVPQRPRSLPQPPQRARTTAR